MISYLRVSTDGQTTENQRRELEAVAARSGWEVVDFYEDAGISGSKGGKSAPAWTGCWRTPQRGVSTWLRHGRLIGLAAVSSTSSSFWMNGALHCNLYLHQQAIDTTTLQTMIGADKTRLNAVGSSIKQRASRRIVLVASLGRRWGRSRR
jgi:resolvase-like protein